MNFGGSKFVYLYTNIFEIVMFLYTYISQYICLLHLLPLIWRISNSVPALGSCLALYIL